MFSQMKKIIYSQPAIKW